MDGHLSDCDRQPTQRDIVGGADLTRRDRLADHLLHGGFLIQVKRRWLAQCHLTEYSQELGPAERRLATTDQQDLVALAPGHPRMPAHVVNDPDATDGRRRENG